MKIKKISTYLLLLSLFFNYTLISCQSKKQMELEELNRPSDIWPTNKNERGNYYYKVSLNSFPGNSATDAGSYFIAEKQKINFLIMEKEWGVTTSAGLNNSHHPLPDSLYLRWFSMSENKFYTGRFPMPKQQIKDYLDQMWSIYSPHTVISPLAYRWERFTDLIVGVAPLGEVVVWIRAGSSEQVEIGHFWAKETTMDWDDFSRLNGMGRGSTRQRYMSHFTNLPPMPLDKVEQYRKKYHWRPKIAYWKPYDLPKEQFKSPKTGIFYYAIEMYNGEKESLYHEYNNENIYKERAVPKEINFQWETTSKQQFSADIYLDEEEIYKAFEFICTAKDTQADLVLMLDEDNELKMVLLQNEEYEYVMVPKNRIWETEYDSQMQYLKDE